jgi:hypothetical protein
MSNKQETQSKAITFLRGNNYMNTDVLRIDGESRLV